MVAGYAGITVADGFAEATVNGAAHEKL